MWEAISTGLSLISTLFSYYVTGKANATELQQANDAFAAARGHGNKAADDRQDIIDQEKRQNDQMDQEAANAATKEVLAPPPVKSPEASSSGTSSGQS